MEAGVVVAGGGPAGICAALAAAEEGADVVLVERYGFVGGNASFIPSIMSFCTARGQQVIQGIPQRIIDRLIETGGCSGHIRRPGTERPAVTVVDNERFVSESLSMLLEAGVRLVLHTLVVDVTTNAGRIESISTESKTGRQAISGQVFVDATGDGDVAARAGVPFDKGRREDGLMQPGTLIFEVCGVEFEEFINYLEDNPSESYMPVSYYRDAPQFIFSGLRDLIQEAKQSGDWPVYKDEIIITALMDRSRASLNVASIPYIDGTDAASLTAAEIEARAAVPRLVGFLRNYVPGFEKVSLSRTAHQFSVRESRRVHGEYVLTAADLRKGRRFSDVVAKCGYWMDVHDPDPLRRSEPISEDSDTTSSPFLLDSYDIPFRSLVPIGIENLVVSGRCISASSEAIGGVRVMAPCMATGQAAGTAAALCVEQGCSVRELDVSSLQDSLRMNGNAFLGE